jgi:hypothetical protein
MARRGAIGLAGARQMLGQILLQQLQYLLARHTFSRNATNQRLIDQRR